MKSAHTGARRIKRIAAVVALLAATTAGLFAARERLSRVGGRSCCRDRDGDGHDRPAGRRSAYRWRGTRAITA